jgi:hypothetical protein
MNTDNNGQTFDGETSFSTPEDIFGPVVYAYTRAQAVADGVQIEVTKTAQEAGIRYPVFLTRAVYDAYVAVPPNVTGQDDHNSRSEQPCLGNHLVAGEGSQPGRLWDVVWMLRFAISRARGHTKGGATCTRLPVALYVRNDNRAPKLVKLIAQCGPLDIDDPSPAITIMLPTED